MDTIGKAAMGIVYRRRDQQICRTNAVKTILRNASSEEEETSLHHKVLQEAKAARILSHPGIGDHLLYCACLSLFFIDHSCKPLSTPAGGMALANGGGE